MHLFVNSVAHVPYHWHKEVENIYVLQGAVTILVDQQQYDLKQDDIIVVNSMSVHKLERTLQDNVLLSLQFSPILLEGETFIACNSSGKTMEDQGCYNQIRRYLAQFVWESTKTATGFRSFSLGLLHLFQRKDRHAVSKIFDAKVFQMFGQNWLIDRSPDRLIEEMIQNFVLMRSK
ncbi:cupin domain-containing protein [Paenibacillus aceris]|uniref:Cupin type-2 domain-containing protein n=1 Tax=Paenibacillus aceris TaxID=869555 RepID=A0ABS4HX45_9BACL|nr:cupin domain-containing protein [Paenibacillus aceris]MBP1963220.1 hypothetical protein [Paenibacillus aceris]